MRWLSCPYLGSVVELTEERERHIERGHPSLLPCHMEELVATVADPDYVGVKPGRGELGFVRACPEFMERHSVVVVVVADQDARGGTVRYWMVTAYISRRTTTWRPIWKRS